MKGFFNYTFPRHRFLEIFLLISGVLLVDGKNLSVMGQQISPTLQQAYLKASNTEMLDYFGISVAVSGDTVVIGAGGDTGTGHPGSGEDSGSPGVNGDQSDNSVLNAGAAYVFVRSGTNWVQQAYLKASNPGTNDHFGYSVAISGETIVVGAREEGSDARGINGDQSNNSLTNAGAAYVFVRQGTNWIQQAYLKASNTESHDLFGLSVSISGNTVLVGAGNKSIESPGTNGVQSNSTVIGAGAAFIFSRTGTNWVQEAYLKASNPEPNADFGLSVSISGENVVIGALGESSDATGVNGVFGTNRVTLSGAAYVFHREGTNWNQEAHLKASNPDAFDTFGWSVSASENRVVVGAPGEASNATEINGNQNDNSSPVSGAAYVFVRQGTDWTQEAYLKASNSIPVSVFGIAVAASDRAIVVGSNSRWPAGAAYHFMWQGSNWIQQAYLQSSNAQSSDDSQIDDFGGAVAIADGTLVIGAGREDSNATGVNGEQFNESAWNAGAAYIFVGGESPALPTLSIAPSGQDIRIAWPISAATYFLDQSSSIVNTNSWFQTPSSHQSNALEFFITVPKTNDQQFFRLRQP